VKGTHAVGTERKREKNNSDGERWLIKAALEGRKALVEGFTQMKSVATLSGQRAK